MEVTKDGVDLAIEAADTQATFDNCNQIEGSCGGWFISKNIMAKAEDIYQEYSTDAWA